MMCWCFAIKVTFTTQDITDDMTTAFCNQKLLTEFVDCIGQHQSSFLELEVVDPPGSVLVRTSVRPIRRLQSSERRHHR